MKPMNQGVDHIGVCVVYFCHNGENKVLMAKRSVNAHDEQGRWDIGGAGMEFGEKADQTLRREIKEEYNAEMIDF